MSIVVSWAGAGSANGSVAANTGLAVITLNSKKTKAKIKARIREPSPYKYR